MQGSGKEHECTAVRWSWCSEKEKKFKEPWLTSMLCYIMDNSIWPKHQSWQMSLHKISHSPWLGSQWGPAVCWPKPLAAVREPAVGRWGRAPGRTGWTAGRPDLDMTRPPAAARGAGQAPQVWWLFTVSSVREWSCRRWVYSQLGAQWLGPALEAYSLCWTEPSGSWASSLNQNQKSQIRTKLMLNYI